MSTATLYRELSLELDSGTHPSTDLFEEHLVGALTHTERERFLDHVTWCPECCDRLRDESDSDSDTPSPLSEAVLRGALEAVVQSLASSCRQTTTGPDEDDTRQSDVFVDKVDRVILEILEELEPQLRARLGQLAQTGRDPEALLTAREYASVMVAQVQVPEPSSWDHLLGPFYRARQLGALLGVSSKAINSRRRRRSLLGMRTEDGVIVYPSFQLDGENKVLAGFPETLRCFRAAPVDGWTLGGWFVTPHEELDGYSVVEAIRFQVELERITDLARDTARRFGQ